MYCVFPTTAPFAVGTKPRPKGYEKEYKDRCGDDAMSSVMPNPKLNLSFYKLVKGHYDGKSATADRVSHIVSCHYRLYLLWQAR